MYTQLKEAVCEANLKLVDFGLVVMTWGNVSQIDRKRGVVAIKPSGVSYDNMTAADMVVIDLDGNVLEGDYKPSSDTPTHLELYKNFPTIGGVTHTHSSCATSFAQAQSAIPCYGTTHADHFYGTIPVTRPLTMQEVETDYELNTGKVIIETFAGKYADEMPAVLVGNHAPFTWGKDAMASVKNAVALEEVAKMVVTQRQINPAAPIVDQYLMDKHYFRKHGANAYYGQK